MGKDWQVFQRDVLDMLRQYEGYFDFFERVGSLSDSSRPDFSGRITREEKKEVWVVDAKNKDKINEDDMERMEKYIERLQSNPLDTGLELSEVSDHEFRGIFVTPRGNPETGKFEHVKLPALHQFLQRELVYTDNDRVVRDIAKMAQRKQLSQSQARLLFRSLKPFENRLRKVISELEEIETRYVGLKLEKPPIDRFDFDAPVDAVLIHENRGKAFLVDVPYSREEVKKTGEKIEQVKNSMSGMDQELYYAAIDTFGEAEGKHVYRLEELENELRETAGIVSPDEIAELFSPKIRYEKSFEDSYIQLQDTENLGFVLRVYTSDDITHRVEAVMPREATGRIRDNLMNMRGSFGEIIENGFRQELEVQEDGKIQYDGNIETWKNFRDRVRSVFSSAVNPVLSSKLKKKA